ncbi:unnamed protein product [Lepeophtheirus salmonis]|uniref:(salmon louse) hypothetical protein n=1 Tax=Lepeophtheirus salmonis TaxID=72036 RepID=A0A7R8H6Z6_LEPSM|nr:unnamed protein product [Lepeophtheirus salmonis]CAF2898496.1 unnamed protein product [Lepeophtheirus salmonis]
MERDIKCSFKERKGLLKKYSLDFFFVSYTYCLVECCYFSKGRREANILCVEDYFDINDEVQTEKSLNSENRGESDEEIGENLEFTEAPVNDKINEGDGVYNVIKPGNVMNTTWTTEGNTVITTTKKDNLTSGSGIIPKTTSRAGNSTLEFKKSSPVENVPSNSENSTSGSEISPSTANVYLKFCSGISPTTANPQTNSETSTLGSRIPNNSTLGSTISLSTESTPSNSNNSTSESGIYPTTTNAQTNYENSTLGSGILPSTTNASSNSENSTSGIPHNSTSGSGISQNGTKGSEIFPMTANITANLENSTSGSKIYYLKGNTTSSSDNSISGSGVLHNSTSGEEIPESVLTALGDEINFTNLTNNLDMKSRLDRFKILQEYYLSDDFMRLKYLANNEYGERTIW